MRALAVLAGVAVVTALGACAGSPLLPGTTKPAPGVWQFAYELSPADAAAINDRLTKRARLTINTTATPGFDQYGLRDEATGTPRGHGFMPSDKLELSFSDCIAALGWCNEMTLTVVSATEMTGSMDYYDEKMSVKVGPAKVTARLVTPESALPSPLPSP